MNGPHTLDYAKKTFAKGQKWEIEAYTAQGTIKIPFELGDNYDTGGGDAIGYRNRAYEKSSFIYQSINWGEGGFLTFVWKDKFYNYHGQCGVKNPYISSNSNAIEGYFTYDLKAFEDFYSKGTTQGMGGCLIKKLS